MSEWQVREKFLEIKFESIDGLRVHMWPRHECLATFDKKHNYIQFTAPPKGTFGPTLKNPGDTYPCRARQRWVLHRAPSSRRSAAVRQPVAFPERGAQAEASAWPAAGHFCWKLQSATWEFLPPFLLYLFPFSWGLAFFSVRLIACLSLCPGLSPSAPLLKDQKCQRENFYKCQIHTPTPLILSCFPKRWVCLAFGL